MDFQQAHRTRREAGLTADANATAACHGDGHDPIRQSHVDRNLLLEVILKSPGEYLNGPRCVDGGFVAWTSGGRKRGTDGIVAVRRPAIEPCRNLGEGGRAPVHEQVDAVAPLLTGAFHELTYRARRTQFLFNGPLKLKKSSQLF